MRLTHVDGFGDCVLLRASLAWGAQVLRLAFLANVAEQLAIHVRVIVCHSEVINCNRYDDDDILRLSHVDV